MIVSCFVVVVVCLFCSVLFLFFRLPQAKSLKPGAAAY